jgi:hypothetical protein
MLVFFLFGCAISRLQIYLIYAFRLAALYHFIQFGNPQNRRNVTDSVIGNFGLPKPPGHRSPLFITFPMTDVFTPAGRSVPVALFKIFRIINFNEYTREGSNKSNGKLPPFPSFEFPHISAVLKKRVWALS